MRRILVALFAFAFLSVAGLVGFALMLNSKVGDIKTEDFGLTGAKGGNGVGEDGTGQDAEATEKIVSGAGENYLVIGSDARAGETFSRSDVIILAHVTEK